MELLQAHELFCQHVLIKVLLSNQTDGMGGGGTAWTQASLADTHASQTLHSNSRVYGHLTRKLCHGFVAEYVFVFVWILFCATVTITMHIIIIIIIFYTAFVQQWVQILVLKRRQRWTVKYELAAETEARMLLILAPGNVEYTDRHDVMLLNA